MRRANMESAPTFRGQIIEIRSKRSERRFGGRI
jgi:hypothetical protein